MTEAAGKIFCHSERSEESSRMRAGEPRAGFFAALRMTGGASLGFLFHLPAHVMLALIRLYQRAVSPVLPAFFGPACGCRFSPTCSHYAAEAVRTHGALAGTWLAARRLLKCTPLHRGGIDLVPLRRPTPRCGRVTA